jgi:hypothetical protein
MHVCAAPFLGPEPPALPPARAPRPDRPLLELLKRLAEPGTALFVDLPAETTLAVAPSLSALGVAVVPVIQRWCVPRAVLPARPLLDRLIALAGSVLRPRDGSRALFLLDGGRSGQRELRPPAHRFDNRYEYPACRFPPPELLRREGVARVVWLSRGGVAADLRGYTAKLAAAGLVPDVVDAGAVPAGSDASSATPVDRARVRGTVRSRPYPGPRPRSRPLASRGSPAVHHVRPGGV